MSIKKHFGGGTLRKVMVAEIKRVLDIEGADHKGRERAAVILGVSAKSLENWILKPEDKYGWPELQEYQVRGAMDKVVGTKPKGKKKRPKKKSASQQNELRT